MALTREGRFVFDYDRVDAVLPELMDVSIDRFTVSKNSEDKIRTLLDLENLDTEEELRAVRNAVVRRLSDMQDKLGEVNDPTLSCLFSHNTLLKYETIDPVPLVPAI